ncbi:MAG: Hg(II)-responsive transcriptional regulator [Caldilineae bacterium]|nr:MAG: Hg(II)-responsive transcriptional regulator [Caldilineae bacterium]
MQGLTIGKLAQAAGVNVETIRYYERRGLLPEPPRTPSGYRQYDAESVRRVRFIKEAQALGFTLEEVGELLALRVDAETTCETVRRRAERKVAQIQEKIQALHQLQTVLEEMIDACAQGGPTGECPILETLNRRAERREG